MKIVFPAVKMFCKGTICFFSHRNERFCVKIMIFVRLLVNILLFFQFLSIDPSFIPSFFSFSGQKARFSLSCTFFTSRKRFSSFVRRIPRVGNVFSKENLVLFLYKCRDKGKANGGGEAVSAIVKKIHEFFLLNAAK